MPREFLMARFNHPRRKPDVGDLLRQFAAEEDEFLEREFLAPALRGGTVRVRIGGVVCRIRIEPADFQGWGVFQPVSHSEAMLVRAASLGERRRYLDLLPMVRLILVRRVGRVWFGSTASFGDTRIRLEGLAPVDLADEVQLFDCIRTRYDGSRFWFDELDMRHDPARSAYLRSTLSERTDPGSLQRSGLTAEERAAYELNYWELVRGAVSDNRDQNRAGDRNGVRSSPDDKAPELDLVRRQLRESLSHAGARLVDYLERADSFRVTFTVGGRSYTSSVNKDDLSVQVAGICLNGEDRKFDLSSLVGVLREAEGTGQIVPVGGVDQGMDEEEYWRVHPPND
jgi:hypothetical protein